MAEPLNLLRDLTKFVQKNPKSSGVGLLDKFKDGQLFILPINGLILDNGGEALPEEARLPFPTIVMEFESELDPSITDDDLAQQMDKMSFINNIYDRHIVFAKETDDEKIRIGLASKFKPGGKYRNAWNCAPFLMEVPRKRAPDGAFECKIIPNHVNSMSYDSPEVSWAEMGLTLLKPAFKALAELLEALACSNVRAEKNVNKKRVAGRRPGELPYDDYHELVVYTSRSGQRNEEGVSLDSGPKRREHLRRGHIRTYKTGLKIWVQAHVVNAGTLGKVNKHYKIAN